MGIESLIVFIIVGAIAGWLAGLIVKGGGFGLLGNIVVGYRRRLHRGPAVSRSRPGVWWRPFSPRSFTPRSAR